MKKLKLSFIALALVLSFGVSAQNVTVDQILDNYFENTGGKDKWKSIESIKMIASINQGGMEIPVEQVRLKDGRTYLKFKVQGNEFKQNVFDGTTLWSTNFQSMKAEKSAKEETDNFKLKIDQFPDPFLNYKKNGYKVELVGEETMDGTETYKVKFTGKPKKVDGKEVEDVSFSYFDKDSFVVLAVDEKISSGPMAGKVSRISFSDYQEVDGLYFPFSMTQEVVGGGSQAINITSYELNKKADEAEFAFPTK